MLQTGVVGAKPEFRGQGSGKYEGLRTKSLVPCISSFSPHSSLPTFFRAGGCGNQGVRGLKKTGLFGPRWGVKYRVFSICLSRGGAKRRRFLRPKTRLRGFWPQKNKLLPANRLRRAVSRSRSPNVTRDRLQRESISRRPSSSHVRRT